MRLLLLGAAGLVGSSTLKLALANPGISEVVAITRRPLPPQNKLLNPVSEQIEELAKAPGVSVVDAVVCALGTTAAKAGTKEALRHVDYGPPALLRERMPRGRCRNICPRIGDRGLHHLDVLLPQNERRVGAGHSANRLSFPHRLQAKYYRGPEERDEKR